MASGAAPPPRRLHFFWGCGSEFHVLDARGASPTVHTVATPNPGPALRKLMLDSLPWHERGMMKELSGQLESDSARLRQALEYSRNISACMADRGGGGQSRDSRAVQATAAAWELLTSLVLEQRLTHGLAAEHVVAWFQRNYAALADAEKSSSVALESAMPRLLALHAGSQPPENDPEYWGAVWAATALGWLDVAVQLLDCHSSWILADSGDTGAVAQRAALDQVRRALLTAPRLLREGGPAGGGVAHESVGDLSIAREAWLQELGDVAATRRWWDACRAADESTFHGLTTALNVLQGAAPALEAACATWEELWVARLLHQRPLASLAELAEVLETCSGVPGGPLKRKGGVGGGDGVGAEGGGGGDAGCLGGEVVAGLVRAVAWGQPQEAVRVLSRMPGGPWLMAHAFRVMDGGAANWRELLRRPLPGGMGGVSQEEAYQLRHARAMASAHGGWRTAMAYLKWCPKRGQPSLDCLLDRLPIGSDAVPERDCWELVRALRGVGQPHAARDVCVRAGRAAAARGDAGAALAWMAESGSLERVQDALVPVTRAIDRFVRQTTLPGPTAASDALLASLDAVARPVAGLLRAWAAARGAPVAALAAEPASQEGAGAAGAEEGSLAAAEAAVRVAGADPAWDPASPRCAPVAALGRVAAYRVLLCSAREVVGREGAEGAGSGAETAAGRAKLSLLCLVGPGGFCADAERVEVLLHARSLLQGLGSFRLSVSDVHALLECLDAAEEGRGGPGDDDAMDGEEEGRGAPLAGAVTALRVTILQALAAAHIHEHSWGQGAAATA